MWGHMTLFTMASADAADDAQVHALRFLESVIEVDHSALEVLRTLGVWDVVYGPAFFFFGQPSFQARCSLEAF